MYGTISFCFLQLEQLYIELFCVLFPTAGERERPDSKPLIIFLQKIFGFQPQRHAEMMEKAKSYQVHIYV